MLLNEATVGVTDPAGQCGNHGRDEFQAAGQERPAISTCMSATEKRTPDRPTSGADAEATNIRADAATLGAVVHIVYAGDYNVYTNTESGVQAMLRRGRDRR